MKIGGIYLSVSAKTTQLKRDLAKAKTMTKKAAVLMNREIGRVSFAKVALASAALGVGMVMLTKRVISLGREFESTMKTVQAWSGATGKDLKNLTDIAREMGATTEHTATQAAGALKFLAAAGFSAEQSIVALPGTLDLATAAQVNLSLATDITTDTMTAFGMKVENLSKVNDAFIVASTGSNTTVEMLGESMRYAAPMAKLMGYNVEQTAAMLGALAGGGIKASMAGAGLNMIMLKSAQYIKTAGIEGLTFIDLLKLMKKEQWDAAKIGKVFGARQVKTADVLASQIPLYEKLHKKMQESAGITQKLAAIMRDQLDNDIKILNSTIEGQLLRTFDKYKDYIRETIQATTKWIRQNPQVIEQIASLSKNMFELAVNMGKVIGLGVQLAGSWSDIAKAMGLAAAGVVEYGDAWQNASNIVKTFDEDMGAEKLRLNFLERVIATGKFTWQVDREAKKLRELITNRKAFLTELKAMEARAKEMIEHDKFAAGLPPKDAEKLATDLAKEAEQKDTWLLKSLDTEMEYHQKSLDAHADYIADYMTQEDEWLLASLDTMMADHQSKLDAQVKLDEKLIDSSEDTANDMTDAFAGWGREFSGTLNEMLWGAETTFGDILKSFGKMITQMMIQKSIIEPMFSGGSSGKGLLGGLLSAGIGALGGGFTSTSPFTTAAQQGISNVTTLWGNGGAFPGGISGFSNGIVNKPTRFNFASGAGLMGEAGAEAIMPLTRTSDGDLGVKTEGGGGGTAIIINAIDSKSFAEVVKRNPQSIVTVIDDALKDRTGLRDTMRSTL